MKIYSFYKFPALSKKFVAIPLTFLPISQRFLLTSEKFPTICRNILRTISLKISAISNRLLPTTKKFHKIGRKFLTTPKMFPIICWMFPGISRKKEPEQVGIWHRITQDITLSLSRSPPCSASSYLCTVGQQLLFVASELPVQGPQWPWDMGGGNYVRLL